jgi:hypothetical protein
VRRIPRTTRRAIAPTSSGSVVISKKDFRFSSSVIRPLLNPQSAFHNSQSFQPPETAVKIASSSRRYRFIAARIPD